MSMREYWFNGTALDVCCLEDFCLEKRYEQLCQDLMDQDIKLPQPLEVFVDENNDIYLTVASYQICMFSDDEKLRQLKFYKKEEVLEQLFDSLHPTYIELESDLDCYLDCFDVKITSIEELKQLFIEKISNRFEEVEICCYG